MDIIYRKITYREIMAFSEMINRFVYYSAIYPDVFTYAAYLKDNDMMEKAGIVQISRNKESSTLKWIYVPKNLRKQGIGRGLINHAFSNEDITTTALADFSDFFLVDTSPDEAISFLEKLGFEDTGNSHEVYHIEGHDIFDIEEDKLSDKPANAVSLNALTPDMIAEAADMLSVSRDSLLMADKNNSFLYEKGTAYEGILLTKKLGNSYIISTFETKETDYRDELIRAFLLGLKNKMRFSDSLIIRDDQLYIDWLSYLVSFSENYTVKSLRRKEN